MVKGEKFGLRKLIEEHKVKRRRDVHDLVKQLTSGLTQEVMNAGLEEDLGYSKYGYKNKNGNSCRNGSYSKRSTAPRELSNCKYSVSTKAIMSLKSSGNTNLTYQPSKIKSCFFIHRASPLGISNGRCKRCTE